MLCVCAFLGGIISNTLPNIKALFTYRAGGLFISYASLADFLLFCFLFSLLCILLLRKENIYGWQVGCFSQRL